MLQLENIYKQFEEFAIRNINLTIEQGDYVVILGRSGAGKTLILELIAGFLVPDQGKIWLNGKEITYLNIQNRDVGLVFQDYAIFPHKTVFQNIAYPLPKNRQLKTKVYELAVKTGVEHLIHRYPSTLSGGEVQRTVLARTLAAEPKVLLLDEPLTSLDVQYKKELQSLLRELNKQGKTIIHVTHDYEEALALSDKVAVMHEGGIVQQGNVHEVFRNPANKFTADFVGIRNFFFAQVLKDNEGKHQLAKVNEQVLIAFVGSNWSSGNCIVTIDARHIILSSEKLQSTALNNFEGVVKEVIPTVHGLEIILDIGVDIAAIVTHESYQSFNLDKGTTVWVSFKASAVSVREL